MRSNKTKQQDVTTPHFRLPFAFTNAGRVVMNEQDTSEDIIDCVKAIVAYPVGSRQNMRSFGIPDLLFQQTSKDIPERIKSAVSTWEPRATYDVTGDHAINDELLWEILLRVMSRDG